MVQAVLVVLGLFSLINAQEYCMDVGPTQTADSELGPVNLVGNSMTIDETSGCPGEVGVQDYTAMEADLSIGGVYTLNYNTLHCGSSGFPWTAGAWIDFNQDGQWTDSERVMSNQNVYGDAIATFTVPTGADTIIKSGKTRMRVQLQESARMPFSPCALFGYGGTKDYSIMIVAPGGGGASGGLSGGSVFLILLTVLSVVYVILGCVYMRRVKGTTTMKESCPNHEFWFGLPGLIMDGCRYTKAKIMNKGGNFQGMSDNDL